MIEMPPWYQDCTIRSRPGTGMMLPLWATQFSFSLWADGSLWKLWPVRVRSSIVAIMLAPQVAGSSARQRGLVPPPHSSVKTTLSPALLKVAECQ